jgi:hypothetical protein
MGVEEHDAQKKRKCCRAGYPEDSLISAVLKQRRNALRGFCAAKCDFAVP